MACIKPLLITDNPASPYPLFCLITPFTYSIINHTYSTQPNLTSKYNYTMTQPKTILITGAAGGIGLATSRHFNTLHPTSTIILTDLPTHQEATESLIQSTFPHPEKAVFLPANIMDWGRMTHLFRTIAQKYGGVDVVVANAGMMESTPVLDLEDVDEETGELRESLEARRVVDVNLMGTLNSMNAFLSFFCALGCEVLMV